MQTVDFYNFSEDDKYEINRKISEREKISKNIITKNLFENYNFLEIGCGNGIFLKYIDDDISYKINYTGLDYSQFQLDIFKNRIFKNNHTIQLLKCNIENTLPIEDNSMDFLYIGEVIEHLYNPDFLIQESFRVLKNNGLLIITTPNLNAWYNRLLFIIGYQPVFYETSTENSLNGFGFLKNIKKDKKPVGHVRIFNKMSLSDLLKNNSFNVLKIKGVPSGVGPKILNYLEKPIDIFPGLSSDLIFLCKK